MHILLTLLIIILCVHILVLYFQQVARHSRETKLRANDIEEVLQYHTFLISHTICNILSPIFDKSLFLPVCHLDILRCSI